MILIAEVKTQSPYGYVAENSWDQQFAIADAVGDWISVHTDDRWGGSLDLVRKAAALTDKPILAKGIHERDEQLNDAFEAGAQFALVVGRYVHDGRILVEVTDTSMLVQLPHTTKVVWNQRDLTTGRRRVIPFKAVRGLWPGWLCQASLLHSRDEIDPRADAALVGQYLTSFI